MKEEFGAVNYHPCLKYLLRLMPRGLFPENLVYYLNAKSGLIA